MVLSYNYVKRNRQRRQTNATFRCWPFRWPWRGVEALHTASHDAACPGLHRKPLDAAIGRLLALNRPMAARATINSMIMKHVPTLLAVLMAIAMRQYYTARIAQWRRFVAFIKANKRHYRTSTHSNSIKPDTPTPVVSDISS
jgi:hypothetical protein